MFILFCVFIFALQKIYTFNASIVSSGGYFFEEGLASKYVPGYLFLLIILLIVINIFIYSLMKRKNKPVLFYEVTVGYGIIVIIALIYFRFFFASLDGNAIEPLRSVINRDIIFFVYLANFFFVIYNFVRGFGFDIKKFSFEQDKKELNIEDTDNEEFELNIDIDKDKLLAKARKEKRELLYYVKENIIFVSLLVIVIVIIFGVKFYKNVIVPNKYYNENELLSYKSVSYKVNSSLFTPYNKYGSIISKGDIFLVVSLDISNMTDNAFTLGNNRFRLNIKDDYYYHNPSMHGSFDDIGVVFRNNQIKGKTTGTYLIVFKLPEKIAGKMYLEILSNASDYTYDRILLNPKNYQKEIKQYQENEVFNVDNVELKFTGYTIEKMSSYEYSECMDNDKNCLTFTKMVSPKINEKLLILDVENAEQLGKEFFDNYLWLKNDSKEYTSNNISIIEVKNNKIFVSVLKSFPDKDFTAIIKKRDVDYNISIKGNNNEK